jgi:hypothetical protein
VRAGERVRDVHGDERHRSAAAPPEVEAAVVVLQRLKALDVRADGGAHLLGRGQVFGLEGGQHVLERGHRDDAGGELLAATERVVVKVDEGVREFLQLRRGGRHFQPAEVSDGVGRGFDRLRDGALVDHAVGGEGFGRGGRVDGERDFCGVRRVARGRGDLEACRAGLGRRDGEAHLDAVLRRDADAAARALGQLGVGRAHGDADAQRAVGLVLQDDGQLRAVAEVEEARRGRAGHERQPRGDRRLALAREFPARDRDGRDAVARQVVGQLDSDLRAPLGVRRQRGGEDGEGVEVMAHVDRKF